MTSLEEVVDVIVLIAKALELIIETRYLQSTVRLNIQKRTDLCKDSIYILSLPGPGSIVLLSFLKFGQHGPDPTAACFKLTLIVRKLVHVPLRLIVGNESRWVGNGLEEGVECKLQS